MILLYLYLCYNEVCYKGTAMNSYYLYVYFSSLRNQKTRKKRKRKPKNDGIEDRRSDIIVNDIRITLHH